MRIIRERSGFPYNPYATPAKASVSITTTTNHPSPPVGRLAGRLVIVPNGARLPDVCLKCGSRVLLRRRHRHFAWAPPWTYVAFVAGLLGALLMFAFQKKASFDVPLCPACTARWDHSNVALTAVGLSIVPYVTVVALAGDGLSHDGTRALVSFGVAAWVGIFTALAMMRANAIVSAARIDAGYTYFDGLHPQAVAALCARETIRHPRAAGAIVNVA